MIEPRRVNIFQNLRSSEDDLNFDFGAEDEARTRDPNLGKVVLYQLSYFCVLSRCFRLGLQRYEQKLNFQTFLRFFSKKVKKSALLRKLRVEVRKIYGIFNADSSIFVSETKLITKYYEKKILIRFLIVCSCPCFCGIRLLLQDFCRMDRG